MSVEILIKRKNLKDFFIKFDIDIIKHLLLIENKPINKYPDFVKSTDFLFKAIIICMN